MKAKLKLAGRYISRMAGRLSRIIEKNPILFCVISAPVLDIIIEMLSRRSPVKGIVYIATHPALLFYNSLVILVTLLAAALMRKRLFSVLFMECLWLWMGAVNCILLGFRVTPFGATDFLNIKSALDIVDIYMTPLEIGAAVGAVVVFLLLMLWFWIKAPKMKVDLKRGGAAFIACAILVAAATRMGVGVGIISESFGNLAQAYDQYGFVYCFAKSLLDRGVDKPDDYSPDVMDDIADELIDDEPEKEPLEHPNIVMVQLESFFNVNRMRGVTFSSNPVPHFTKLLEESPSGLLTVPVIGAGTVNTEFEVISGMSLDYFGTGEYPYKTILRSTVCPSICYDLEKYGYTSHAIHNNNGTFYDRHKVYPNLGFDDFTSEEYMDNLRETPLGWMKDSILTEHIINALDSTDGSDFVYTVSVQPHGKYPTEYDKGELPFSVYGIEDEGRRVQFQYYATQLYDTDNFVDMLLKALDSRGEPYIAVFFGDHLPSLAITDEELSVGTIYQTEYVICTNTGLHVDGGALSSYQLSARVLEMAGLPGGLLATLHQTYTDEESYQQKLELLEYDLLYGDKEVLGGEMPFEAKDMKMGVKEIKITSVELREDGLYVTGENITDKSHIFVNGKPFGDTQRIDLDTLVSDDIGLESGDVITIVQMGSDGEPLSYTEEYTYTAPDEK